MMLGVAAMLLLQLAETVPSGGAAAAAPGPAAVDSCEPSAITDADNAGCGRNFPRFHPKNAKPLAHNNDANAPFEFEGTHHVFMQALFPGITGWTAGAIGLAHLASKDLATWVVAPPALVPGHWGGPVGTVGQPAGNATEGYCTYTAIPTVT